MKIVVFGPDRRTGVMVDGAVVDLSLAYAKYLRECEGVDHPIPLAECFAPSDLTLLIEGGHRALDNLQVALDHLSNAHDQNDPRGEPMVFPVAGVRLHAPHPRGGRIACAGSNFITHRKRMALRGGRVETAPFIWGFWQVAHDVAGPGQEVIYPARCDRFDYEGEVAVVLGKRGKDLRGSDLKDFVWGVTLANDWSIRGPREPRGPMNFAVEKNFDTSLSLGPCIVVGEGLDPADIAFETLVNGQLRQSSNTREMVFSFAEYLEYLSRDLTLYPGDVICSGTPEGTIADASPILEDGTQDKDLFLQIGDRVEVVSPAIGSLPSWIVAKSEKRQ